MATRTALTRVLGCVPGARGAPRSWPGDAFGRLLAALGSPGASPGRLWAATWASLRRPERVRTRPQNGFGRRKQPRIDFSSIFRRLRLRLGRFFHVFFVVCSFAFRSPCFLQCTRGQRPNHTTIARDPPNDKRNAQVSRSSCVLLLQLACTTSAIIPTTCDPTIVTLRQGKCT